MGEKTVIANGQTYHPDGYVLVLLDGEKASVTGEFSLKVLEPMLMKLALKAMSGLGK